MKKIFISIIIFVFLSQTVYANSKPDKLLIIEVMTGTATSATAEFVEIYNPGNNIVDLSGYKLEYKSAEGSSWLTKASLEGKLGPRARFLLATTVMNITSSATIASGLPATGGHLRISKEEQVLDLLGWGTANLPEDLAVPVHINGESLKRKVDEDGMFIDTDNNFLDWFSSVKPSPSFDKHIEEPSTPSTPVIPAPSSTQTQTNSTSSNKSASKSYPKIYLSELFIDPKSPLTDKEDEFIEIYNPNNQPVDLSKYQIQTGSTTWRYKFEIEAKIIPPNSYVAFYSEESGLTLSNSGAKAQVLDPNGTVNDGISYEKAKAGQSLVKIDDKWLWSDSPTPNQPNTAQNEADESSSSGSSSAENDSNFPMVAGSSSEKDKQDKSESNQSEFSEKSKINPSVLVIVGGLALLYGLYEYRQDIKSRLAKIRRYFSDWRKTRKFAKRQ